MTSGFFNKLDAMLSSSFCVNFELVFLSIFVVNFVVFTIPGVWGPMIVCVQEMNSMLDGDIAVTEAEVKTDGIEVFVLDSDGSIIGKPDDFCDLLVSIDPGYCFCNQDSDSDCTHCGLCSHCCRGECVAYTRYTPDDFETRSAFYIWLMDCTCRCDGGSCAKCYLCQGCCACGQV